MTVCEWMEKEGRDVDRSMEAVTNIQVRNSMEKDVGDGKSIPRREEASGSRIRVPGMSRCTPQVLCDQRTWREAAVYTAYMTGEIWAFGHNVHSILLGLKLLDFIPKVVGTHSQILKKTVDMIRFNTQKFTI